MTKLASEARTRPLASTEAFQQFQDGIRVRCEEVELIGSHGLFGDGDKNGAVIDSVHGRAILVIGGSSGIGLEIARQECPRGNSRHKGSIRRRDSAGTRRGW